MKYIERTLGTRECGCPRYDKIRDQIVSCCACYQNLDRADPDNTHEDLQRGNCPGASYCDLCNSDRGSNIQSEDSASNVSTRHSTIVPDNDEDNDLKVAMDSQTGTDKEMDKMSIVKEWLTRKPIEKGMYAVENGRWRIPQVLRVIVKDRSALTPDEIQEEITEFITYEVQNIADLSLDKNEITKACYNGEKTLDIDRPIPKAYMKDTPSVQDIARHLKQETCMIFSPKPKEVVDRESQTIVVRARKPFSKEMEVNKGSSVSPHDSLTKSRIGNDTRETAGKKGKKEENKNIETSTKRATTRKVKNQDQTKMLKSIREMIESSLKLIKEQIQTLSNQKGAKSGVEEVIADMALRMEETEKELEKSNEEIGKLKEQLEVTKAMAQISGQEKTGNQTKQKEEAQQSEIDRLESELDFQKIHEKTLQEIHQERERRMEETVDKLIAQNEELEEKAQTW